MKKFFYLNAPLFSKAAALITIALVFSTPAGAQNPKISIQGTLRAANGTSVADGTYNVTFKLYTTETGGSALWQETAPVEVVGSIYSHYLGSVTPLVPANFSQTLYLGVTVNNYELIPRTELSYSPYAFSVAFAQKVVCSGAVGDVKYSVLNPAQFAAQNGDCWVPMDGRAISGSQLAAITGWANVPDAGGLFLRSQEFSGGADNDPGRTSATAIATLQQDEFESHDHDMETTGEHTHPIGVRGFETNGSNGADGSGDLPNIFTKPAGDHQHDIYPRGGDETRPKNLNLWIYIRVN
ncbi:MAG: hypothetical protein SFV52_12000 [Saprospiraceae bacterium]|nr:hypothetical protein [Saprospiraceae bacterium]